MLINAAGNTQKHDLWPFRPKHQFVSFGGLVAVLCVVAPMWFAMTCVVSCLHSIRAHAWLSLSQDLARTAIVRALVQRCFEGDPVSMGAIGILASQRHCRRMWQCQALTALVMAAAYNRFGWTRVFAMCVMSFVAPLFPPRLKRLSELGSAQWHHNGFRARIKLGHREQHIGPLRDTEAEALPDLAEMRGATSRADVGLVAARLRADAALHRVQRVATQDAEAPLRADAATRRVHRKTTGGVEVSLRTETIAGKVCISATLRALGPLDDSVA